MKVSLRYIGYGYFYIALLDPIL